MQLLKVVCDDASCFVQAITNRLDEEIQSTEFGDDRWNKKAMSDIKKKLKGIEVSDSGVRDESRCRKCKFF